MLRQVRSHGLDIDHINAPNCSCGWSTSALVGRIYVRVYARAETDCVPSSTNTFTNLFPSIILSSFFRGLCVNNARISSSLLISLDLSKQYFSVYCSVHKTNVLIKFYIFSQNFGTKGKLKTHGPNPWWISQVKYVTSKRYQWRNSFVHPNSLTD